MSAIHSCPFCNRPLPEGDAAATVKELLTKPLTDSAKVGAMLAYMERHNLAQFGKQGMKNHPEVGHSFLNVCGKVDLYLFDSMAFGSAEAIVNELSGVPRLEALWLNSGGGVLAEASRIADALRGKTLVCNIFECCASSAWLVAFAADRILIHPKATMACHPAVAAVMGNSSAMRKTASELDAATAQVMAAVQVRTGKSADEIRTWFSGPDRYFSASEAVSLGIVDGFFEVSP